MVITSLPFLGFIGLTSIVYHLTPRKLRYLVLLCASIIFYLSFSVLGVFVLIGTALLTWISALQVQKIKDAEKNWISKNRRLVDKETHRARKAAFHRRQSVWVALVVIVSIGILFMCKYYGHIANELNYLLNARLWTAENILLPLGISYYSLQLIGYIADVSRDIIPAEKNPLKVILFAAFFLSIMQGPFNRYNDLMPQIGGEDSCKPDWARIRHAGYRIMAGFVKKLCIADQVAIIANEVFANYSYYTGLGILLGVCCFALQLYADFSGYMDIMIGIGELFDLQLPENFRQPFFSRNILEFWRRWHITLGLWLKDYVFYPILKSGLFKNLGRLSTSRFGKNVGHSIPTYIGMLILWMLIGVWHGSELHYMFSMGLLQFLYIFLGEIAQPLFSRTKSTLKIQENDLPLRIFQSLKVTVLMLFAWSFFRAGSINDALCLLKNMACADILRWESLVYIFEGFSQSALSGQMYERWLVYIAFSVIMLLVIDFIHEKGIHIRRWLAGKGHMVRLCVALGLVLFLMIFGAYGTQYVASNFLYFEF